MNVALSLFTLALLGADAPAPAAVKASPVVFQIQVVEMTGLDWRSKHFAKLSHVTEREGAGVWTAPATVLADLVQSSSETATRVKLMAEPEKFAHFNYHAKADANGPIEASSPKPERTREGIAATLTGRKLDQGILTKIAIEETRVLSVHHVPASGDQGVKPVDIKEVAGADIAGEWLIPRDGVLIVSLGVHTVADASSKAVVKERLALIEASSVVPAVQPEAAKSMSGLHGRLHSVSVVTQVLPAMIPMPFAAIPSRSLPQPLDAKGKVVSLPPLPAEPAPPTTFSVSSEPCSTPQAGVVKKSELLVERVIDRETSPAEYLLALPSGSEPAATATDSKAEISMPKIIVTPVRNFQFRLPGHGVIAIEIRGLPDTSTVAPLPPPVPTSDAMVK